LAVNLNFTMRTICLCILLLISSVAVARPQSPAGGEGSFPMAPGTRWVYQGLVRWDAGNSGEVSEKRVVWETSVVRVIRRGNLLAAIVEGFPSELDWSDGNPPRKDSLLIQSKDGGFYLIDEEDFAPSLKSLEDSHDDLHGLLVEDALILHLPLTQGEKICGPDGMQRDDSMYCWIVESNRDADLETVKGAPPGKRTVFTLTWSSNPDDTEVEFVPGLGITAYSYHHHGTTADTELKLLEFHPGGSN
jgi:hypothetical protein